MRNLIFSTIILALLFSGCTPSIYTLSSYDEFEDAHTLEMKNNRVSNQSVSAQALNNLLSDYGTVEELQLNLEYHKNAGKNGQLYVIAEVEVTNDLFFIDRGTSLVLLVDGERYDLETDGEYDSKMGLTNSFKTRKAAKARYPMNLELLEEIIQANTVKARLITYEANAEVRDKKTLEGTFQPYNFEAWQEFYQKMQEAQASL